MLSVRLINGDGGFFGEVKWGIEVTPGVIGGQIARREGYWYDGRRRKIYTAFYPSNGSWKNEEFIRYKKAKDWLLKDLQAKWSD